MKNNISVSTEETQEHNFTRRKLFTGLGISTFLGAGLSSLTPHAGHAYPAPKAETATRYRNSAHVQRFYQLNRK